MCVMKRPPGSPSRRSQLTGMQSGELPGGLKKITGALNPKGTKTIKDIAASRTKKCVDAGQPVPNYKTEMDFLNDPAANPVVAWPMKLFDCSPITDGAACVLLVAADIARNFTDKPVYVIGTGQASDYALHGRKDLTEIKASQLASKEAYDMAGVTPKDIQLAEVHDCFTIAEIVATEDLGFFPQGEGPKAAATGVTARDGAKPINTSGGLKSKGHPVGASGVGQAIEVFKQLRGDAGPRQVPNKNLRLGLTTTWGHRRHIGNSHLRKAVNNSGTERFHCDFVQQVPRRKETDGVEVQEMRGRLPAAAPFVPRLP